jgi:hypothetical protein
VIHPDGSYLACPVPAPSPASFNPDSWDPGFGPGFLPDGRLAVSLETIDPREPRFGAVNTDGVSYRQLIVSRHW